jgi:signal transduction histidine kinase
VIFDPFQRGPAEQHRGIKGIGLGLYIAQQIVRAHGGEITVRSSPVAGTTFSVSLPRSVAGTSTDSTP